MQHINKHVHWRTLKTQNMKIISFCIQKNFSLLLQIKTDGNDTLLLSLPKTGGYHRQYIAGLLCFARGVPTNQ